MYLQKQIFVLISMVVSISISSAKNHLENNTLSVSDASTIEQIVPHQISLTDSIVNYGKLFINTPYQYGSSGDDTFDCSGFTSFVYRNFGYNLLRSSAEQAQQFDTVDRNQLKIGDLVFFSGRRRNKHVGHVGIVTNTKENGQFEFIHAAVHSGVVISNSEETYYTQRFIKANRVINSDLFLATESSTFSKDIPTTTDLNISTPLSNPVKQTKKIIPAEYHRVKSGETLSSIARKYGISIPELKRKNQLKNSAIQPKQQLKIKDEETIMLAEPTKAIASNSSSIIKNSRTKQEFANFDSTSLVTNTKKNPSIHIVKNGETLFSISKLNKVSIDELKNINGLKTTNIHPNQKLILNQDNAFANNSKLDLNEKPLKTSSDKTTGNKNGSDISKTNNTLVAGLQKINHTEDIVLQKKQEIKISQNRRDSIINTVSSRTGAEAQNITHKVKFGETLFSISKKYNTSVDDLMRINQIDGSKICPGQDLVVSQTNKTATYSTVKANNKLNKTFHKVKSGDTYSSIAKTYACTVKDLKDWNNKTGSKIKAGEKLIILAVAD